MVTRTQHAQRSHCPVACGLDLIGDHWTLLIVRDLLFLGRHEYGQMLEGDEGISSNILSDRLSKLQRRGLVGQLPHPENKKKKLYYLTAMGKDLIYVLVAIVRWSNKHLGDQVALPEAIVAELGKTPDQFVKTTLHRLQQWEQQHNVS